MVTIKKTNMKLYKNLSAIFLALLVVMAACKKDEVKVVYSGGTTPTRWRARLSL